MTSRRGSKAACSTHYRLTALLFTCCMPLTLHRRIAATWESSSRQHMRSPHVTIMQRFICLLRLPLLCCVCRAACSTRYRLTTPLSTSSKCHRSHSVCRVECCAAVFVAIVVCSTLVDCVCVACCRIVCCLHVKLTYICSHACRLVTCYSSCIRQYYTRELAVRAMLFGWQRTCRILDNA